MFVRRPAPGTTAPPGPTMTVPPCPASSSQLVRLIFPLAHRMHLACASKPEPRHRAHVSVGPLCAAGLSRSISPLPLQKGHGGAPLPLQLGQSRSVFPTASFPDPLHVGHLYGTCLDPPQVGQGSTPAKPSP
jgi:hypothetical protein